MIGPADSGHVTTDGGDRQRRRMAENAATLELRAQGELINESRVAGLDNVGLIRTGSVALVTVVYGESLQQRPVKARG